MAAVQNLVTQVGRRMLFSGFPHESGMHTKSRDSTLFYYLSG